MRGFGHLVASPPISREFIIGVSALRMHFPGRSSPGSPLLYTNFVLVVYICVVHCASKRNRRLPQSLLWTTTQYQIEQYNYLGPLLNRDYWFQWQQPTTSHSGCGTASPKNARPPPCHRPALRNQPCCKFSQEKRLMFCFCRTFSRGKNDNGFGRADVHVVSN